MTTSKKGRPPTWHQRIEAPQEALDFYAHLAALQSSTAFQTCHVYAGTTPRTTGIPLLRFDGKIHALPYVIASFMGIPYSAASKVCSTHGCCNPFHYSPPDRIESIPPDRIAFIPPDAVGNGWDDLVLYYIEEKGLAPSFDILRAAIPAEDIDDINLEAALERYLSPKSGPGPGNET